MSTANESQLAVILGRRSIRIYCPGQIDETTVTRLLEAAMAAPSAMTKDPWRFVIVREKQTLAKMAAALPGGKMLSTACLSIVVCGDLEAAFENHLSYMLQDCSAAIENLLIAAHVLNLGACWVGIHPGEDSVRQIKQILELPRQIIPIAAISLGLPGEQLPARTRFNPAFVRSEKW